MADSKIEWTERSDWNPVRGCTRVSPGCGGPGPHGGCYAEAIAGRFSDPGQAFHGFATRTSAGGRWTGNVEVQWDRLTLPLGWRKPAVIFANSTSDIFHEALPDHEIAAIYAVAVAAHHLRGHTTQIVTKRPERAAELLRSDVFWDQVNVEAGAHVMDRTDPLNRRSNDARATLGDYDAASPPPGVWIGVSVENQEWADKRRESARAISAVMRFVSYEPALGPVNWTGWEFVDQIIGGGESGPRARPMHPDWQRATRDFCASNEIAYFFKQWGEWLPEGQSDHLETTATHNARWEPGYYRVGKRAAGRLLDGVQHDGMPA